MAMIKCTIQQAALVVALLAVATVLLAADRGPPPPEHAVTCIKKSNDPVSCFTAQATYRVMYCKLSIKLDDPGACTTNGDYDLSDFYEATLKRFAKNKDAQSLTKDYYALWQSSMGAFATSNPQALRLESEWKQKGNRLALEK